MGYKRNSSSLVLLGQKLTFVCDSVCFISKLDNFWLSWTVHNVLFFHVVGAVDCQVQQAVILVFTVSEMWREWKMPVGTGLGEK